MTEVERFEKKFSVTPECWVWTASLDTQGYGQHHYHGVQRGAHRVAHELYVGAIPLGLHVLHKCDNRRCVNPDHLFLGTHQDNMRDRNQKGRQAHNVGETGGGSKLTRQKILQIKADSRSQRAISMDYGVSQGLISFIKLGKRWAHVQELS